MCPTVSAAIKYLIANIAFDQTRSLEATVGAVANIFCCQFSSGIRNINEEIVIQVSHLMISSTITVSSESSVTVMASSLTFSPVSPPLFTLTMSNLSPAPDSTPLILSHL